jgi:hypothetical protein
MQVVIYQDGFSGFSGNHLPVPALILQASMLQHFSSAIFIISGVGGSVDRIWVGG